METDDVVVSSNQTETRISDDEILPSPPALEEPPPQSQANLEPMPRVVVGSESWHNGLPTTWLPVITRDLGRQRRVVRIEY